MIREFKAFLLFPLRLWGSGGGGGPSSTTVNNSNIPDYLQSQAVDITNLATASANNPYAGYQDSGQTQTLANGQQSAAGQQVAGLTDAQRAAMQTVSGMQAPTAAYGAANTATQNTMNNSWNDPGTAASFMNPYAMNVTDIANQQAARNANIQGTHDASQFASAGAFGGSRQGVVDAERERNLGIQQSNNTMAGLNNAFTAGQAQYNAQNQNTLNAANQLNSNAIGQQTANLGLANAQNTMGGQEQALNQNILNQANQNFTNKQNYNMNQALMASSVLHGTPYSTNSTQQNYQAPPNTGAQLTGLGIAGLGASQAGGTK